jgi:hypothetical protein
VTVRPSVDGASIGDGVKPIIIQFIGSKHRVTYWGENRIDIGCKTYGIEVWKNVYNEIGVNNNYSNEEIQEYKNYINIIDSIHNQKSNQ